MSGPKKRNGERLSSQRRAEALDLNRKIIEASSLGIAAYDADGNCILANDAVAAIVGATREQLLCQNAFELASWKHAGMDRVARLVLEDGRERRQGVHLTSSFGKELWLDCRFVPFSSGGEGLLLLVLDDVTPWKLAEGKLVQGQAVLRAVNRILTETLTCESVAEVASVCLDHAERLTGSEFGWIGVLNPQGTVDAIALSDPGWEACRLPRSDAVVLLKELRLTSFWGEVFRTGKSIIVNDSADHPARSGSPEGHPVVENFLGVPLLDRGRATGIICLANRAGGYSDDDSRNIEFLSVSFVGAMSRKRGDERLESTLASLAQSNAELEQFAYAASHDLQEPLRKIQAFGERLEEESRGRISDKGADYLFRMRRAAGRLQSIVNGLLDYARISGARRETEAVPLATLVKQVIVDLRQRVVESGAEIVIRDLPTVEGDRLQLGQMFQNLLDNALKFHRLDAPPRVTISHEIDGPHCLLFVDDDGVGFDDKQADRIFEVFRRAHSSRDFTGTGIGLSVVRRIAERHGGSVSAASSPGEGTRFTIRLPLKQTRHER